MKPNIALLGGMGSGKSTAADLLEDQWEYKRLAFADPLRELVTNLWPDGSQNTNRFPLVVLGAAVRSIDPDYWVNALHERLTNTATVVDDVRMPNEYDMLRGEGFVFIRIVADNITRADRLNRSGKTGDMEHETEHALDEFPVDYTITNNDSRIDLAARLFEVVRREARNRA